MMDGITDVIAGRRRLEDYDGLVKDWASSGGDQIRKELADAMAQGGSSESGPLIAGSSSG